MLRNSNHSDFGAKSCLLFSLLLCGTSLYAAESGRAWKAIPARPYVVRGVERRLLDRAKHYLANQQWDDALAALMQLLNTEDSGVVAVDDDHFVSLPQYCHRQIAQLPAETLQRYRQLVDATCEAWYQRAVDERDDRLLQRIIDRHFYSSWGDDALLALGELSLERGDYQAARSIWSQLKPHVDRLSFSDVSEAAMLARLALVSIREENWHRAEQELTELREAFPSGAGWFGGREQVVYAEYVARLLKQARLAESLRAQTAWHTFGATTTRANVIGVSEQLESFEMLWSTPVENGDLALHPSITNGLVVFQDESAVHARKLSDGELVFSAEGAIFQTAESGRYTAGRRYHTLTAADDCIYGVTLAPLGAGDKRSASDSLSRVWCLDLQRDGALSFEIAR